MAMKMNVSMWMLAMFDDEMIFFFKYHQIILPFHQTTPNIYINDWLDSVYNLTHISTTGPYLPLVSMSILACVTNMYDLT